MPRVDLPGKKFRWRFLAAIAASLFAALAANALLQQIQASQPSHIPSNISWTDQTLKTVSAGNALRGLLLAKRCEHCHGAEGFSQSPVTPNLAAMDKFAIWKQMEDFRDRKRSSLVMQPIAASLNGRDYADLAVYYSMFPAYPDPQDDRSFPQKLPESAEITTAARLIKSGDGLRGIPPCQACHGPVAYRMGAPSLTMQNSDYIFAQLQAFAAGTRANDVNMPMRTIAGLLTADERRALAGYYGSGSALLPGQADGSQPR